MKGAVKESTVKNTNGNSRESAVDLQEQIRRRAYELYERRGGEDGRETEDWLQAEADLVGERTINLAGAAVKKNRKTPVHRQSKSQAG
jgi:Protein of unknown function (DUF2934)